MRLKAFLLLVALIGVVLLIAGVGTFVVADSDAEQRSASELLREATALGEAIDLVASDQNIPRERLTQIQNALSQGGIGLIILSGTDIVLSVEIPGGILADDLDLDAFRAGQSQTGDINGTRFAAAVRPVANDAQIVVVLTEDPPEEVRPWFGWFVLAAGAGVLLSVPAAWWLARRSAAPVVEARRVAQRIADGDLGARMMSPDERADDEPARLARAMNEMGEAFQRAQGLERQFLLSVSHDLRTPMTSIQGYAEALTDDAIADPAQAGRVILGESRRLDRLVRDLLELARLDSRQFSLDLRPADLSDLLQEVVAGQLPAARAAGVDLTTDTPPDPCVARVDTDRLAQALANLIENGARFAAGRVHVSLTRAGGWCELAVADDGPGIADADLPHVFERLYRAEHRPRDRESGSGLGLAIVRELVLAMGGTVAAARSQLGGAELTIRLPVDDADAHTTHPQVGR